MMLQRIISCAVCACILLALGGCGNKGPLTLPEEEQQKKKQRSSSSY